MEVDEELGPHGDVGLEMDDGDFPGDGLNGSDDDEISSSASISSSSSPPSRLKPESTERLLPVLASEQEGSASRDHPFFTHRAIPSPNLRQRENLDSSIATTFIEALFWKAFNL
ncbi:hypothetical protein QJS10_CPA07g00153 [Acorus calamus]|uniref:Uncharacterized protein n=1 Tax=Acorus calamus TaxID=4465 RepID=A0AAV9EFE3_ACOCL|nr:hypothetical protein QJS10_CPA07g00153 [Acorus calamus]